MMFTYDNKKYSTVWFTSDEHYNSGRHLSLSCRYGFTDALIKERQYRDTKEILTKSDIPEVLQKIVLRNLNNGEYGIANTNTKNGIELMNDTFINNHNIRVSNNDIVFHVGDFGDYKFAEYLNGAHVLLMGNYEEDECKKTFNNSFTDFRNHIISNYNFIDVIEDMTFKVDEDESTIKDDISTIYVTHKPSNCFYNHTDNEYVKSEGKILMNLFGHIHEKCKIKRFGLNVGVDGHHYYPLSMEEVEFYLTAILKYYNEEVFM